MANFRFTNPTQYRFYILLFEIVSFVIQVISSYVISRAFCETIRMTFGVCVCVCVCVQGIVVLLDGF